MIHSINDGLLPFLEIIGALLTAGADANKTTENGLTALIYASCERFVEVVKLQFAAGAVKGKIERRGNGAPTVATGKGHHEVVELLSRERGGR